MWGGEAKEGSKSAHYARPDQVVQASQGNVGEEAWGNFLGKERLTALDLLLTSVNDGPNHQHGLTVELTGEGKKHTRHDATEYLKVIADSSTCVRALMK
jgi:hypothetical protein